MRARCMVWLVCGLLAAGCSQQHTETRDSAQVSNAQDPQPVPELPERALRFGRPPHLSVAATKKEYEPLVRYLAESIGHAIELVVPDDYDDVPSQLQAGELDMALLTPLSYVRAKGRIDGLRLIASLIGEGSARYRGYVVVSAASAVTSLEHLRGKAFAFVDPGSTSGYLFPMALLRDRGIVPERDFSRVTFAGSHAAVARGIVDGKFDGGAISSTTYQHLRGEFLASRLTIVAKTAWIPLDAFVTHPSLPAAVSQKLRKTLLGLSVRSAEGRVVLTGMTITNGFVPGDDAAYDAVRGVAELLAVDAIPAPHEGQP